MAATTASINTDLLEWEPMNTVVRTQYHPQITFLTEGQFKKKHEQKTIT